MRIRVVSTAIGATAVVISIVAACGGYGGSSGMGGGVYGGSAAPTVAFSTPAAAMNVNLGQAVKLAWTSTNATSCTASASSMTGGTFSGSQAVSGEMNVVPTATGSVTYTLSCSGAGGMTNASSASVTVNPAIITQLASVTPTTIGSTIDPVTHEGNPYGLAIAPVTAGLITAGDLIVCNFNDNGNPPVQGHGTTVVGLHPTSGATPYHIAGDAKLQGCNAVTVLPDDSISGAAFTANMNPLVTAAGAVNTPFAADSFNGPWGEAYAAANGANPAAIYVSNFDGSIDRIALNGDAQTSFTKIASGFCASGSPGAIYAPAGLTYDAAIDTLYIVDTSSNSVVALANVSAIGAGGVVVNGGCNTVASPPTPAPTFSGSAAASARVIAHGAPLFTPLSATLLGDGNLIVTNADINIGAGQMPNLAIEVSPVFPGGFVGSPLQLDTSSTPGALFGIVATADAQGHQIIYFNDDNTNAVMKIATP
ncbi:MAG: hypothetical protein JOZ34_03070 [Gammaproteobacteria bacterium]|nr:hypothetical protein [Gammaproteobacteria bacterium]